MTVSLLTIIVIFGWSLLVIVACSVAAGGFGKYSRSENTQDTMLLKFLCGMVCICLILLMFISYMLLFEEDWITLSMATLTP